MGGSAEALSALCNGKIKGDNPAVMLRWFVCLSIAMVTGGLYYLWNRVYWIPPPTCGAIFDISVS